ncbi:SH3 domain-containing protein [Thalassotalea sediminis]|uniref:C40 family peptidase n=1 Tax=Thalassotalea sediminis TaxID=1759089 RepID=UPI002572686C|nr:SH3 domain-containing protein [Thalassotalea sediminis]
MKISFSASVFAALTIIGITACSGVNDVNQTSKPLASDVIGIHQGHLHSSYWKKPQAQQSIIMAQAAIKQFNQKLFDNNPYVVDPLSMDNVLTKQHVIALINKISSVPTSKRFYADGTLLEKSHFDRYLSNVNLKNVKETQTTKWGLAVKRSSLRTFPTHDRVFNSAMDTDLDRFQETGIFPGEAVAIIHESADQQWLLVRSYNYLAWVPKEAIAIGSKNEITRFMQAEDFIVVTGDKVFTNFVPNNNRISQVQLDMGVKLPLVNADDLGGELHGQNPFASHVVRMPVRNEKGTLAFSLALIAKSQDISIGYLPFTKENIINQAFKFLGERYGWGHDYNARDCTGFVGEVYKTFGIVMPRNSTWQGKSQYGINVNFNKASTIEEKLSAINSLEVGDLLYIPGHVVMFLGYDQGKPYVIHDVKGMSYFDQNNQYYRGTLNGVSVTPLLPLQLSKNTSYIDRIYNIKRIRSH